MGDYVARGVEMVGDEARTIEMADTLFQTNFGTNSPFCRIFTSLSQRDEKKKQQIFPYQATSPYLCSIKSRKVIS